MSKRYDKVTNSKVSLCQRDMTKLNIHVIVNSANKTIIDGGGIDGAIHKAAGSGLLGKCQNLNGWETGESKITLGYELLTNNLFHTMRTRDQNNHKQSNCYKSCLQIVLAYNVKSITFCSRAVDIPGFDQRNAAKITSATLGRIKSFFYWASFLVHMKMQIMKIYENLMFIVYSHVSKHHLSNTYMKENSNTDCDVDSTAIRCGSFSKKILKKNTCAIMIRIIVTFTNQIFL